MSESNAGGRYQFAEPQQEERFYPRKGDRAQTAAILAKAATWYDGQLSGELLATMRAMTDQADRTEGD